MWHERYSYLMASSLINYSACGLYLGMGENFLEVKDKREGKELSLTTSLNPVLRSRTTLVFVVARKVSSFYNCAPVCLSASLVLSWTACPGFYMYKHPRRRWKCVVARENYNRHMFPIVYNCCASCGCSECGAWDKRVRKVTYQWS